MKGARFDGGERTIKPDMLELLESHVRPHMGLILSNKRKEKIAGARSPQFDEVIRRFSGWSCAGDHPPITMNST